MNRKENIMSLLSYFSHDYSSYNRMHSGVRYKEAKLHNEGDMRLFDLERANKIPYHIMHHCKAICTMNNNSESLSINMHSEVDHCYVEKVYKDRIYY